MILIGDSALILKDFKDESIDCVVTSPPYWALRDYKTEGSIWDADPNCDHQWDEHVTGLNSGNRNGGDGTTLGGGKIKLIQNHQKKDTSIAGFCSKCNAWKGSFGLEPTFQLYIKHMLDIFDQIKRVLKKEGTCWVVLGDTYAGSCNGQGDRNLTGRCKSTIGTPKTKQKPPEDIQDKSLCMIPERFAIGMIDRGWILRNDIIWHKPNCMPSSATDRFTVDYEHIFFFVKSQRYYFKTQYELLETKPHKPGNKKTYDEKYTRHFSYKSLDREWANPEGRIKRAVWNITTQPYPDAHFAVFPEELIKTPIIAGCPEKICLQCGQPETIEYEEQRVFTRPGINSKYHDMKDNISKNPQGYINRSRRSEVTRTNPAVKSCNCNAGFKAGTVLDPFSGSGTTLLAAHKLLRNFIGIEINPDYVQLAKKRLTPYVQQQRLESFPVEID